MKKKILFIIWSFTAGGGAEKILANVANNLDEDKYEISILEFSNFNIKKENIKHSITLIKPILKIRKNNKKIASITSKIKNKIIYLLARNFPGVIRKVFIKEKYDIEVAFNYGIPSFLVSKKDQGQKVCWVHSSIEDLDYRNEFKNKYKVKRKYIRQYRAFLNIDNIVAISNRTEESIKELYPCISNKIERIYNGYDFSDIINKSKEDLVIENGNKKIIVSIGRLVQQKNFSLLIDIAHELKKKKLDFIIYIIGEGEQWQLLSDKIYKKELGENVKLLGYLDNPYTYLNKADLFCLTSETEGFPTVLIESMTLGCPFISTNVAGADELSLDGRCGIITDNDPCNISDLIISTINDKEKLKCMSKECIRKANEYSLKNQKKKVEEIL